MVREHIIKEIITRIQTCTDEVLLDLILKLLIESSN